MQFLKNTTNRSLVLLLVLAVGLNIGRAVATSRILDLYLTWNLFLGFVPFLISAFLVWYVGRPKTYAFVVATAFLVWLAFFPNAPYLVTDLIHVRTSLSIPIWYNILMLYASAAAGLFMMCYSLWHIETVLYTYFKRPIVWTILAVTLIFTSFGIYIGRFLRWNSWDLLMSPREIWHDLVLLFTNTGPHQDGFAFTAIFFVFLVAVYASWRFTRA